MATEFRETATYYNDHKKYMLVYIFVYFYRGLKDYTDLAYLSLTLSDIPILILGIPVVSFFEGYLAAQLSKATLYYTMRFLHPAEWPLENIIRNMFLSIPCFAASTFPTHKSLLVFDKRPIHWNPRILWKVFWI